MYYVSQIFSLIWPLFAIILFIDLFAVNTKSQNFLEINWKHYFYKHFIKKKTCSKNPAGLGLGVTECGPRKEKINWQLQLINFFLLPEKVV